jgi:hypothetical protein
LKLETGYVSRSTPPCVASKCPARTRRMSSGSVVAQSRLLALRIVAACDTAAKRRTLKPGQVTPSVQVFQPALKRAK